MVARLPVTPAKIFVDDSFNPDERVYLFQVIHGGDAATATNIHLTGRCSKICLGSGEGTTRRHILPSCLIDQPLAAANFSAIAFS
jgi:hypothetical protein